VLDAGTVVVAAGAVVALEALEVPVVVGTATPIDDDEHAASITAAIVTAQVRRSGR
jgi:hypothetical protein